MGDGGNSSSSGAPEAALTEEEVGVVVAALDVLGRQMAALYDLAAQLHFASKVRPLSRPYLSPYLGPYLALI